MTTLSKLTLKSVERKTVGDPVQQRRRKLMDAIDEQTRVAEAAESGKQHTVTRKAWVTNDDGEKLSIDKQRVVKPWFWEQDGGWYVQCKYGSRALELGKGRNAAFVAKLSDVRGALASLRAAVEVGELDASIAKAIERKPK